jgi:hypothetical protein
MLKEGKGQGYTRKNFGEIMSIIRKLNSLIKSICETKMENVRKFNKNREKITEHNHKKVKVTSRTH